MTFEDGDWTSEQRAALVDLHSSLESFKESFGGVLAAGLKPTEALIACGYDVPLFARPMVNTLLST